VSAAVNRGVKWHSREIAGVVSRTEAKLERAGDGDLRRRAT